MFLLPVQLSGVAGPGALIRYWRDSRVAGPTTRLLVLGTLPDVVIGTLIRVFLVPGPRVFRLLIAAVLLPWACGLAPAPCARAATHPTGHRPRTRPTAAPDDEPLHHRAGRRSRHRGGIYGLAAVDVPTMPNDLRS
ncbi:hypothetical protein GCM10010464_29230 [Pseudonocardia yunnanensis]|uniref:Uncharacterized protein n=1 Tax=Pseudonocardia yunnanensis TaxID=58107 RepID=A0ABW4EWY1_9PSEU